MSRGFIGTQNPWETEETKEDERVKRILSKRGLDAIRVDLRAQGYMVEALNKPREQQTREHRQTHSQGGQADLNLAAHPLVQPSAGQIDTIIIPEGDLSKDLSTQTLKEQHKHKHKQRLEMAQKLQQKYQLKQRQVYQPRSRPAPKPTPK